MNVWENIAANHKVIANLGVAALALGLRPWRLRPARGAPAHALAGLRGGLRAALPALVRALRGDLRLRGPLCGARRGRFPADGPSARGLRAERTADLGRI